MSSVRKTVRTLGLVAVLAMATGGVERPSQAQLKGGSVDWCQETKLLAPDGTISDEFGFVVAMNDDFLFSGAPLDDGVTGAVYVFRRIGDDWVFETKLTAFDGAPGDRYASSVSLNENVLVVSSHNDDDNGEDSGSAYVYRYNGVTWAFEQKLTASDGEADDFYGRSVAAAGTLIAVGARHDDDNGEDAGAAYVYRYNGGTWVEEDKLLAPDGAPGDYFGFSVAATPIRVLVGAKLDDDLGEDSGSAHIFRRTGSTWLHESKLVALGGQASEEFGRSVAMSGDRALVGAFNGFHHGVQSGTAFVYKYNGLGWPLEKKLAPEDGETNDTYSWGMAIDDEVICVGSRKDSDAGDSSGSAYVYRFNGVEWEQEQKISPSDGGFGDQFGFTVAVRGIDIVIGAAFDSDNGLFSGSTYTFKACDGAIDIGRTSDPPELCPGVPTDVLFTYSVTSPGGYDLEEVLVDDDGCGPIVFVGGDDDKDGHLDVNEVWLYECATTVVGGSQVTSLATGAAIPSGAQFAADHEFMIPVIEDSITVMDLVEVITGWGPCPDPPDPCPGDANGDGSVDVADIVLVITNWGPCFP